MKKTFLTALSIGLFVLSSASFVQALTLTQDYNSLFTSSPTGYTVIPQGVTGLEMVYDSGSELVGYAGGSFSGIYLGTVTGTPTSGGGNQITEADMEKLISTFLGTSYNASLYLKVDGTDGTDSKDGVTLTVASNSDKKSGTWAVSPNNYALDFYGVKGSNEWALYFVDPALVSGKWSTENLLNNGGNIPAISHFAGTVTSAPIPEPTVTMLFALGVAGFAGMVRRNVTKR